MLVRARVRLFGNEMMMMKERGGARGVGSSRWGGRLNKEITFYVLSSRNHHTQSQESPPNTRIRMLGIRLASALLHLPHSFFYVFARTHTTGQTGIDTSPPHTTQDHGSLF